jgi:uncharacterized protein (TIGR03663 family)
MNRAVILALLPALAAALILRCAQLDARPMHNDEAVNAIKFRALWEHGSYEFDPNEYHGPTLFYATLAESKLTGAPDFNHFNETRLRMATVVFGAALIFLLALLADGLGPKGAIWAAWIAACSPAFVFYSRDFIHEMLLVFFNLLALAAAWRYSRKPKTDWAALTGASVGLMQATKETFVLAIMAAVAGLILNWLWTQHIDAAEKQERVRFNKKHLVAGFAAWLATVVILFSSFFTHWAGLLDSLRTYQMYLGRAWNTSPHLHPWYFYFERLLYFHYGKGPVWSEALIALLGLIGIVAIFRHKLVLGASAAFLRFMAFYTVTLTALYCLVSYKTPWCALSFWLGWILLAGVGAAAIIHYAPRRWMKAAACVLIAVGIAQLAWQSWQESIAYCASPANPYVYAQTSPDILNLVERVESLAKVSPEGHKTVIKVMSPEDDYWPLPWYLRDFNNTGWWSKVPDDPLAPIMIVSSSMDQQLGDIKNHQMVGIFGLRPGVFLVLYVEADLWKAFLPEPGPK